MAILEPYRPSEIVGLAQRVQAVVQNSGIVALPTETFYGLGVNPFDERALDRLFRVKGRDEAKPILVLIGNSAQLALLTREVSSTAARLMAAFWPGALTILFPAHGSLARELTRGTDMVGVRWSSCVPLTELLKLVGPLTGTSANRSGDPPLRTAEQVRQQLGADIDLIVDAGETPGGLPSTVVDAREPWRIIREGAVSRQMIRNVLQTQARR